MSPEPEPVSLETLQELADWAYMIVSLNRQNAVTRVLRHPREAQLYVELANKTHLSIYFLYQIYDWLLIHQHELVKHILMPYFCPRCNYRVLPPEMIENQESPD
jgi:hypothetical protein